MNRWFSIFALILFSTLVLAQEEQHFAELDTCKVESGEVIQGCRIGYHTWGKLNPDKSNVVVMLTWFGGKSEQYAGNIGSANYVDPAKFFIVAIDALANGVSSSPSNSTAQPHMKFPQITIADMVETEHRLLVEALKLNHVHAVMGASMGGMQTFQWVVQYPEFMDVAIPIVGSTQLTPYDLLLWRAEKNAILEAKEWNGGEYKAPLRIAAVDDIHDLGLSTPSRVNEKVTRSDFESTTRRHETSDSFDPNDRIRQLEAMMSQDIAKGFGGSMEAAAKAVKARMLIVVAAQDHMVNPQPALAFAQLLRVQPVVLQSSCGHLAAGCEPTQVTNAVQQMLASK